MLYDIVVSWTVLGGVLRATAPNIGTTEGRILYVGINRRDAPGWVRWPSEARREVRGLR